MEQQKTMTIQQAAATLLKEVKRPLKSKELAQMVIEKGLIPLGSAKDPIQSMSQTIERNIRLNKGNNPKLIFVEQGGNRCIALPAWNEAPVREEKKVKTETIGIALPDDLVNKVQLYQNSFKFSNMEQAMISLIKKGLAAASDELIDKLKKELEQL